LRYIATQRDGAARPARYALYRVPGL